MLTHIHSVTAGILLLLSFALVIRVYKVEEYDPPAKQKRWVCTGSGKSKVCGYQG